MDREPLEYEGSSVVIVGGGPTGLALALGLARLNVRSTLLEKNPGTSERSKAPGIHVRSREVFSTWGVEEEFLAAGNLRQKIDVHSSGDDAILFSVDFRELEAEASKPGLLVLEQGETEGILYRAVKNTGLCELRFNTEVTAIQTEEKRIIVTAETAEGAVDRLAATYVIGCDGASSFVRDALKLPFEGSTYFLKAILADIMINDSRDKLPWPRIYNGKGITMGIRLRKGLWRIIRLETGRPDKNDREPKAELEERMEEVLGEGDFEAEWVNRFKIHQRSSPRFKVGRVLLAGDAAHVHSPAGGQGMNAGIQDAHNLAWKLAAVLEGKPEELLDSYEAERREVVLKNISRYTNFVTRTFLMSPSLFRKVSFFLTRRILVVKTFRMKFLRRTTMINLRYKNSAKSGCRSKSTGKRLPNPEITGPQGEKIRLYELLDYRPVILELKDVQMVKKSPYFKIIRIGNGSYNDPSGLLKELIGKQEGWVLVRPDAHILWAGNDRKKMEDQKQLFIK